METKLKPNEVYRGYTIVNMVEHPGEVRIMDALCIGAYLNTSDDKDEIATFGCFDSAKAWIDARIRNGDLRDESLPRTRIGVSDTKGLQFVVSTPGGDITVESVGDIAYPDASIFINGHCVAFVEWHPDSKQFNLHYYGSSDDQPQATFENITE